MALFSKLTDSRSFLCIRIQNLGTYLSTELHSWKALLKLSIPNFLQPGTAIVLSRTVCWTLKAGGGDRVPCCVVLMDLDVQSPVCVITLHLFHSIHLGWSYPWKIQKFDAFLAQDDDASDTVGVKYRSKIVKEALCWRSVLGLNLQPCDSSEFWIRPCIAFLVYMYMDNTSIGFFIILNFFPQVAENWKCSSTFHQIVTHLTNLLLEQIVSLEFICFLQAYSQIFPGLISYHLRKGKKMKHILITCIDLIP